MLRRARFEVSGGLGRDAFAWVERLFDPGGGGRRAVFGTQLGAKRTGSSAIGWISDQVGDRGGERFGCHEIQEETPSLNRAAIEQMWDRCFKLAKEQVESEMNIESNVTALTWKQVFDTEYEIRSESCSFGHAYAKPQAAR